MMKEDYTNSLIGFILHAEFADVIAISMTHSSTQKTVDSTKTTHLHQNLTIYYHLLTLITLEKLFYHYIFLLDI